MNKIIIGAWAASVGVAFYAGTLNTSPSLNVNQTESNSSKEHLNSVRSDKSLISVKDKAQNQLRISTSRKIKKPLSSIVAELQSLAEDSSIGSTYSDIYFESYTLVKDLNEEELAEALGLMDLESLNHSNMKPLLLLLNKYAEYNPQNAIAFHESNISSQQLKDSALNTIISQWSKNDPDSAYDWFIKNSEEDSNNGTAYSSSWSWYHIFQGLAKNDLATTIEKLEEVENLGYKDRYASMGLSSALKTKEEFVDFFKQTKNLDNKKLKEDALRNWVRQDPNEAVTWLDTLEKDHRKKYEGQVLSGWMRNNPVDAADWYFKVSENKQKATDTAARHWTWKNPQAAMEWVESQQGINTADSVKKVIEAAVYQNPDFVIKNLHK